MSTPAEAALDALAEQLAPRVLRLLRERTGTEDALTELLAASGFELDDSAQPAPTTEPARRSKKTRAA